MSEVKLLPLPEKASDETGEEWTEAQMEAYARANMEPLLAENERLRGEVAEWVCEACNTVYQGPPQQGLVCVTCSKCGGLTGPRMGVELRRLREEVTDLRRWRSEDKAMCDGMEQRAVAAEARAERLAEALREAADDLERGIDARIVVAQLRAALDQEGGN